MNWRQPRLPTGLKNSCVFPRNWSTQHVIPQGPSGQSGAGTQGSRSFNWGCSPRAIWQPRVGDSCWNGRTSPQGRLLSSLAKHPALPLPQLYQNMHFFYKANRERGSNFATKKAHSFHGCLITFYHNTNNEQICFKQRICSPLQTDNNPIKEPTSRILGNVSPCVIISIPLVLWRGMTMLSWSSWEHSKAQLIGATAAPLSSDCHANNTRFFYISIIQGVSYQIISRQVREIQFFTLYWWYLSKIYSGRGFKGMPLCWQKLINN